MDVIGRLAPSPTGLLHVGNARSLLGAWLAARASGGKILLRIEDLLPDFAGHEEALLQDLLWLGLDWDPTPPGLGTVEPQLLSSDAGLSQWAPKQNSWQRQSLRQDVYLRIFKHLQRSGLVYPCICTRKDVEQAARAPHRDDQAVAYPGLCRGRFSHVSEALAQEAALAAAQGRAPLGVAWRLNITALRPEFAVLPNSWLDDAVAGPQWLAPDAAGDFVLGRKDGGFAYMFAVVVDDIAAGVNQVVRGDDLLQATEQQARVYQALRQVAWQVSEDDQDTAFWQRVRRSLLPVYGHLPLVHGDDGRRLAKRNQSIQIRAIRQQGVRSDRLMLWLTASLGLPALPDAAAAVAHWDWSTIASTPVVFGGKELAAVMPTDGHAPARA